MGRSRDVRAGIVEALPEGMRMDQKKVITILPRACGRTRAMEIGAAAASAQFSGSRC